MDQRLNQAIRKAQRHCAANLLLESFRTLGWICGALMILAVLAEKLLGFEILGLRWNVTLTVVGLFALVIVMLRGFPRRLAVSLLLDDRLQFKERLSTVLSLEQSDDPFVRAACQEALEWIDQVDVARAVPVRLTRRWAWVVAAWLSGWAVYTWLPQQDLLGQLARRQEQEAQQARMLQTKANLAAAAASVKRVALSMPDPILKEDLAHLDAALEQADPNMARRQAIRTLGDMSDKLRQKAQLDQQAAEQLKQMLRQLRGTPQALSQELQLALAQGKFNQAASLMRSLQQQLMKQQLSPEDRANLQQQLQDLARQLQQLAQQRQGQMENELSKLGLDKKIAKMDETQARKALAASGLTPEQIKKLMQKMAACQSAANRASQLGQAMAAGGSEGLGDLSEAISALDQMDAFAQEEAMNEAMLESLRQCIGTMGQGLGSNGQGSGNGRGWGGGMGSQQPGKGIGTAAAGGYDVPPDEAVTLEKTRSTSKTRKGEIVASWYFQGETIKGQAARPIEQVMQAASQQASEAIEDHRIPKKYETAVKRYFGQIGTSDNSEGDAGETQAADE